jgi:hypothetical protein
MFLLSSQIIKSIVEINDNISTLLLENELNYEILKELNIKLDIKINPPKSHNVKSNVAIAAAVTAYGRIHMMPFKLEPGCVYSDTDSLFTTNKFNDTFLNHELGNFKEELLGNIIKEAYFFGIKQYGYRYYDINNNNKLIERSTWAGVKKDDISFDEIIRIFNGDIINKEVKKPRFIRNFTQLNITVKDDISVKIKHNPYKKLINNEYIPLNINNLSHPFDNRQAIIKIYRIFKKFLNLLSSP